jgi:hypothetical protein
MFFFFRADPNGYRIIPYKIDALSFKEGASKVLKLVPDSCVVFRANALKVVTVTHSNALTPSATDNP